MAFNVPTTNSKRYSFGPAVLFLGAIGGTPLTADDVGSVRGSVLTLTRETLDVLQGSPQVLVEQFATRYTAQLEATGIEWNMTNMQKVLGGQLTTTGNTDELLIGGALDIDSVALRLRHVLPSGSTVFVDFWQATGSGNMTINFNPTELHEFPLTFLALEASTGWGSQTLPEKGKLARLLLQRAP